MYGPDGVIWLEACLSDPVKKGESLIDNVVLARAYRLSIAAAASLFLAAACFSARMNREPAAPQPAAVSAASDSVSPTSTVADTTPQPVRAELSHENEFFDDAATAAFKQFDKLWRPRTGLAASTPDYARLTPWDIGSVIASNYAAHRLGLLDDAAYDKRQRTTLNTLAKIPLYRGAVFHKMYFADNARMADHAGRITNVGYGWSATDLGRLLNWLRIIATTEPQYHDVVQRIVHRINFNETTADGYMYGGLNGTHGKLWKFQEGRIGYEQYAAQGFQFWGAAVQNAVDLHKNSQPVDVLGVEVLGDKRGLDRLNSEPFVLMGMEIGFTADMKQLAEAVLAAQEARFHQTGHLTMVSEDAVSVPPYYFYYYCVLCNGRAFTVDVAQTGKRLDEPRWVSTKASFGYHALLATPYTKQVLEKIADAKTVRGWSSGIFEKNGKSTNTFDINTAAVVLEAALYHKLGRPFVTAATSL